METRTREKLAAGGQGDGWQSGKMAVSDRGAGWQSGALGQCRAARAPRVHRWLAVRAHKIIDESVAGYMIAVKVHAEPLTSITQR